MDTSTFLSSLTSQNKSPKIMVFCWKIKVWHSGKTLWCALICKLPLLFFMFLFWDRENYFERWMGDDGFHSMYCRNKETGCVSALLWMRWWSITGYHKQIRSSLPICTPGWRQMIRAKVFMSKETMQLNEINTIMKCNCFDCLFF